MLADDVVVDLVPLAEEICLRYAAEFPDERAELGDAGRAWCVHDNQYLLCWGVESVKGHIDLQGEVDWLANVLEARGFPLERLARNLDIGAEVVVTHLEGGPVQQLASALAAAAESVRRRVGTDGGSSQA